MALQLCSQLPSEWRLRAACRQNLAKDEPAAGASECPHAAMPDDNDTHTAMCTVQEAELALDSLNSWERRRFSRLARTGRPLLLSVTQE